MRYHGCSPQLVCVYPRDSLLPLGYLPLGDSRSQSRAIQEGQVVLGDPGDQMGTLDIQGDQAVPQYPHQPDPANIGL